MPPSAAGVDARGLLAFLDVLEGDPGIRPHGLVVLRGGALIAEGSWAPYDADRGHLLYSLSKSFTMTAVALAAQEGLLDLDATVLSYFPELDADVTDPRSRSMTLRHVAAMASGHRDDAIDRAWSTDPEDLVRGFLLVPPDEEPGSVFAYNQPCTYSLASVVQRVSGGTLVEFLRPRLFEPLGIGEVAWIQHPSGRDLGFSGLHATTDAVARLGELYRRQGMWGDRRILDAARVEQATRRQIATPPGPVDWSQGYGYQFWMSQHGYRGDGAYGQFCVVVPEAELVVAITSETPETQRVLDALWAHVLPAMEAPGDPAGDAALAARLSGPRMPVPVASAEPHRPDDWADVTLPTRRGPLDSVRIAGGPDSGWSLTLTDERGALDVPLGRGEWLTSEPGGIPVAASGGWTVSGELEAEILFLDTPHTLRIVCRDADGDAEATWLTEPLHDASVHGQRRP
jgi:CubicO group peptidase (beta-lactamase class C family)